MLLLLLAGLLGLASGMQAQQARLTGVVREKKGGETLIGVNVFTDQGKGVASNETGRYQLTLDPGTHLIHFSFVGFQEADQVIHLEPGEEAVLDVFLVEETTLLQGVVVSAGKFEQRLENVTVSMEVIKPALIGSSNPKTLDAVLNKVPGVNILDGQANIRNGSGYSYGTGSRVLLVVDNLPMLSPDAGDAKWNFLPLENIEQVEILKGASSALFGSSALNGVIHVRTAFPQGEPSTTLSTYAGGYLNPSRSSNKWWDSPRSFKDLSLSHSRKMGALDLITGFSLFQDDGYRTSNSEKRARVNANLRWRSRRVPGLIMGLNANAMGLDKCDFFIWKDQNHVYEQDTTTLNPFTGVRINLDPYLTYLRNDREKHSLQTRFFRVKNQFDGEGKNNRSDLYYMEYQYQRKFREETVLTLGTVLAHAQGTAELFGNHRSWNQSVFAQFDTRIFQTLTLSAGTRWESYKIDADWSHSKPIFRTGLNYQLGPYSFLRASFGQGYRFPSIAEKYTSTYIGPLKVFPNPDLMAEKGWSAELGFKQGLKMGNWSGLVDLAAFLTQYRNMMEFTFGIWDTDSILTLDDLGFKSTNVGNARISGFEVVLTGAGRVGRIETTVLIGYTYTDPVDLDNDPLDPTQTDAGSMLKYRFYHSARGDVECRWHGFFVGLGGFYNSFMKNIDAAFQGSSQIGLPPFLPGLKEYRQENDHGEVVLDLRIGYALSPSASLSFLLNNMANNEYMGRPGDVGAPRNASVKYTQKF